MGRARARTIATASDSASHLLHGASTWLVVVPNLGTTVELGEQAQQEAADPRCRKQPGGVR